MSEESFELRRGSSNRKSNYRESTVDSTADIILQAIQDGDISSIEFHKVLPEVDNIVNSRLKLK